MKCQAEMDCDFMWQAGEGAGIVEITKMAGEYLDGIKKELV